MTAKDDAPIDGGPAKLTGVYCCQCGTETQCEWDDLNIGQVFECPNCKVVWGHVVPHGGGRAWVEIHEEDVKFYSLLSREAKP